MWFVLAAGWMASALGATVQADVADDFSANPLTDGAALVRGPDAAQVNSRFTYDSAGHTLTAHYDSALPTVKLVFPLGGQHVTQDTSFTMSTTFMILSGGFFSPPDFGAEAPSFGLINSMTTGNARASTGYSDANWHFTEVTPGTSYDYLAFEYFPSSSFGNSICVDEIDSAQNGVLFDDSAHYGYTVDTLPLDQLITTTLTYNASTHQASLDWGAGPMPANLTGAAFNVDSFGITLWQDPNLSPDAPAVAFGSRVAADVVFDSFSVTVTPEPGSLALLAGALLLLRRKNRGCR